MESKQIQTPLLRKVILAGQQGAVSTTDITDIFLDHELYGKLFYGWNTGASKKEKGLKLTVEEVRDLGRAINMMANTFLDASKHFPKQIRHKGE